jgi:hypothetical protein
LLQVKTAAIAAIKDVAKDGVAPSLEMIQAVAAPVFHVRFFCLQSHVFCTRMLAISPKGDVLYRETSAVPTYAAVYRQLA